MRAGKPAKEPAPRRCRRAYVWVAICMVPLFFWLLGPHHPRIAGIWHDDGVYLSLGQSLVDRGVYRDGHTPQPIQIAKYPPGVPLIAALGSAVTGNLEGTITVCRLGNLLFLALGLLSFYRLLERQQLVAAAPFLVMAVAWSPAVLDYLRVSMSEIPYLGVALITVLALVRCGDADERPWPDAVRLACLGLLAMLLRMFGITLVLTILTHLLLVRRRRTALRVALTLLPAIAALQAFLMLHARPAAGYEDVTIYGLPYLRLFFESLDHVHRTVFTNALQIAYFALQEMLPPAVFLPPQFPFRWALAWFAVLAVGWLLARGVPADLGAREEPARIRPWHHLLLYSVGLMLPWPAQGARFLLPLTPFLQLLLVRGIQRVGGRAHLAAALLCIATLATSLPTRAVQTLDSFSFAGDKRDFGPLLHLAGRMKQAIANSDQAVLASTMDLVLAQHGGMTGVWGWTITADRHIYHDPPDPWHFNLGIEKWRWVERETWAARLFYLRAANPHRRIDAPELHKKGDEREPLLRRLEQDRQLVREQFRRLGVTHAVILLMDGNPIYDVLLARLVRELAEHGRAELVRELSTETAQVWRIRA